MKKYDGLLQWTHPDDPRFLLPLAQGLQFCVKPFLSMVHLSWENQLFNVCNELAYSHVLKMAKRPLHVDKRHFGRFLLCNQYTYKYIVLYSVSCHGIIKISRRSLIILTFLTNSTHRIVGFSSPKQSFSSYP